MKPTLLEDITELPDGAIIYLVHARLKNVYARKHGLIKKGTNTGKPWALQNLVLEQDGVELPCVLKDHETDVPKSWQGKEVVLTAYQGDKGWSGLYAFDDDYTDPAQRKLKVTGTGEIALASGESAPAKKAEPQQQQPAKQQPAKEPQREPAPEPPTDPAPQDTEKEEKNRMRQAQHNAIQIANMQLLALTTVETYVTPRFELKSGRKLSDTEKHAWAMNLSIEMARSGTHHLMPKRLFKEQPPETPPSTSTIPTTWRGQPWPDGAVPHPDDGAPCDPRTGEYVF